MIAIGRTTVRCLIEVELGWRQYLEKFDSLAGARLFISEVLRGEKFKWVSETKIAAKDGVLTIEGEDLEEVMKLKPTGTLQKHQRDQIEHFLTGHWPKSKVVPGYYQAATPSSSRAPSSTTDLIPLAVICQRHGWKPSRARAMLRKAGEGRGGRWAWDEREALEIEKKLGKLFKG